MSSRSIPKSQPATKFLGPETEADVAELAALFSTQSGDQLSAQLSVELALEIVLNQIVEHACVATGATGAAVILEREGDMVCRASSGANAPELGARLDSENGLTAECIRTRRPQRCDDALYDPLANAEASRYLGVRSVMVLPLLTRGRLAGVLEVFSSLPASFSDRDERTLQVLGYRILKDLETSERLSAVTESLTDPTNIGADSELGIDESRIVTGPAPSVETPVEDLRNVFVNVDRTLVDDPGASAAPTAVKTPKNGMSALTASLATACVTCALLIVSVVAIRLAVSRNLARMRQNAYSVARQSETQTNARPQSALQVQSAAQERNSQTSLPAAPGTNADSTESKQVPPGSAGITPSVPLGGLVVFENGREVFRMLPGGAGPHAPIQKASEIEPVNVAELSPQAAQSSLLYRVEPEYPEEARQQRIQGPVVLEVRIGRDGVVQDATIVSGAGILGEAAVAAVKQWKFKPHLVQGQPVPMQTRITLDFRMPH